MFIAAPLLFVLFIPSCFDPPLFSLGCSARGSIKPVIGSPGGRDELGQWEIPSHRASTAPEGDFLLGKGQEEGMGKIWNMFEAKSVFLFKQTFEVKNQNRLKEGRVQWRELEGENVNWAAQIWQSGVGWNCCVQSGQQSGRFRLNQSSSAAVAIFNACLGETCVFLCIPCFPRTAKIPFSMSAGEGGCLKSACR